MKNLLFLLIVILLGSCSRPEVETDLLLIAYPNPATRQIIVSFKNEQRLPCTIRIFDPNAKQIVEMKVEAGIPTDGIRFDVEGYDKGTYQVAVETGGITLI
ncbi:T9SS type A sorting domain-containing protein, partial [Dyadobacter sp. CY323]|uniref:T9SS type A sorting domain-containing protein n=1 Tax=Dyadobacter sp. CY323 TaxID=2907302 RepID=UPI001F3A4FBC